MSTPNQIIGKLFFLELLNRAFFERISYTELNLRDVFVRQDFKHLNIVRVMLMIGVTDPDVRAFGSYSHSKTKNKNRPKMITAIAMAATFFSTCLPVFIKTKS